MKPTWKEFRYDYIETGWFDYERTKTLKAMQRFWSKVPSSDLDKLPGDLIVFAPSLEKLGEVLPWYTPSGTERNGAFIYLSPALERKPQWEVDSTVAHEFAHVMLGHHSATEGLGPRKLLICQPDAPSEIAADKLVVKWGFAPAYKRKRGRRSAE